MKNGSSVALSVLGTLAVAGYVCYTEFPFWERWTKSEASSTKPRLIERTPKKPREPRQPRERVENRQPEHRPSENRPPEPVEPPPRKYRDGDQGIYLIDEICDCKERHAFVLDTVELTANETILTILNSQQAEVSAYPKGNEYAQYLSEWRYVKGNRPRLDLKELRGIPAFPETASPVEFQLVFPRVSDEAPKFQLNGKASSKLDYFMYTSIELSDKMSPQRIAKHDGFKRCGFNAVPELIEGQKQRFSAHKRPGARDFSWSVSDALEIVGRSRGDAVQIRGTATGAGEVCLDASFEGEACRYCQDVAVRPHTDQIATDFEMTRCGGLPSREPHWQFTVTEPKRGATYFWEVKPGLVKRSSSRKPTFRITPFLRPGRFTITLTTTSKAGTGKVTREYHPVYSCIERD